MALAVGRMTPARIIRSRRRSVALIVTREAELIVRAPWKVPVGAIERFISQKENWVLRKIAEARARQKRSVPRRFENGETFLFLGQAYALKVLESAKEIYIDGGDLVLPSAFLGEAREHLSAWYRAQARRIIPDRVSFFAQRDGFSYKSIRISSARRRWGSCGSRGDLHFSWRLVMLPIEAIDYLAIHELHHLRHRNHSAVYWDGVRRSLPSFEEAESLLRGYEDAVAI